MGVLNKYFSSDSFLLNAVSICYIKNMEFKLSICWLIFISVDAADELIEDGHIFHGRCIGFFGVKGLWYYYYYAHSQGECYKYVDKKTERVNSCKCYQLAGAVEIFYLTEGVDDPLVSDYSLSDYILYEAKAYKVDSHNGCSLGSYACGDASGNFRSRNIADFSVIPDFRSKDIAEFSVPVGIQFVVDETFITLTSETTGSAMLTSETTLTDPFECVREIVDQGSRVYLRVYDTLNAQGGLKCVREKSCPANMIYQWGGKTDAFDRNKHFIYTEVGANVGDETQVGWYLNLKTPKIKINRKLECSYDAGAPQISQFGYSYPYYLKGLDGHFCSVGTYICRNMYQETSSSSTPKNINLLYAMPEELGDVPSFFPFFRLSKTFSGSLPDGMINCKEQDLLMFGSIMCDKRMPEVCYNETTSRMPEEDECVEKTNKEV